VVEQEYVNLVEEVDMLIPHPESVIIVMEMEGAPHAEEKLYAIIVKVEERYTKKNGLNKIE